jgi:hypothetical protein
MKSNGASFVTLLLMGALLSGTPTSADPPLPAQGEWDGVTPSAHLETPYEDQAQSFVPFGEVSYYMLPWRSYLDTWSAQHYEGSEGVNFNIDPKYADAVGQVMSQAGIRTVRIEIGWGNLDWNDQLPDSFKQRNQPIFDMCRKYGIRPMILLNANHGQPCPVRDAPVTLVAAAKKGDTTLQLAPGTQVHVGYTGPHDMVTYAAACPLIIKAIIWRTARRFPPVRRRSMAG